MPAAAAFRLGINIRTHRKTIRAPLVAGMSAKEETAMNPTTVGETGVRAVRPRPGTCLVTRGRMLCYTRVLALAVLTATAVLTAGCGGSGTVGTAGTPRGRLLSVADLPAGWSAVPAIPEGVQAGRDPAGTQAAKIAVPTLIADGTEDQLVPLANSHILASLIPGARLTLYPDAGHAFLFQDQTAFVPLIESFLG